MYCILIGHHYENEMQTITQVFYPNEKFILLDSISDSGITVISSLNGNLSYSAVYMDGALVDSHEMRMETEVASDKDKKRIVKLCVYHVLKQITGHEPPWGALTGIRPSKIARLLLDEGKSREEAAGVIRKTYRVSQEKTDLSIQVAEAERELLSKYQTSDGAEASLYVGIPFCPTRCLYCSFTSNPISQSADVYLQCLAKEMEALRDFFAQKRLSSVYIGGGTPTSLNENQLEFLLRRMRDILYLGDSIEFTVEAGRPDTLNKDKLQILREYGVTRISINPQTMNDDTLVRIGRRHTVGDFIEGFRLAREAGHDNINTDIILGLPGETAEDVANTMAGLAELAPDSVTVHTLAVKRASKLKENLSEYTVASDVEEMLLISRSGCEKMDQHPYYMYRQKNMLGNFENVGYSLRGRECLYNVIMMEETQSVIAVGAGGVSKLVHTESNRIDRLFNVKNVEEYIRRIDEMIERKGGIIPPPSLPL